MLQIYYFWEFIKVLSDYQNHNVREISQSIGVSERTVIRYRIFAEDLGLKIESKCGRYGYYRLLSKKIP